MNITDIATEMKRKAEESPFDALAIMKKMLAEGTDPLAVMEKILAGDLPSNPVEDYSRSFVFENLELKVTLTFDIMMGKKGWHLSIGSQWGDTEISDELCVKLLPVFLPLKYRPIELPSQHGPLCRQFLEPVE